MGFTVKHVGPVMEAFVDSKRASSRFPNKDCETQKRLNIKPDRPDLSVVVGKTEVAFGEITGTYMRLKEATRGMFVLEEVGAFAIPVTVEMITSFMTNIQTLMIAQVGRFQSIYWADIEKIATGPLDQLKRFWGYKDLDKNKRLLVQGSKGRKAVRRSEPEGADGTLELGHAPPRNCNELSDAEHE
ncbi:hypothetical protein BGX30_006020 [Mortierella sp. GBA39]|nr:hypothetical protein BGX30_006020 [Mortierella sp. GBA39]